MNKMVYYKIMQAIHDFYVKNKKKIDPFTDFLENNCGYFLQFGIRKKFTDIAEFLYFPVINETVPVLIDNKILHVFNGLSYKSWHEFLPMSNQNIEYFRKYIKFEKIDKYRIIFIERKIDYYYKDIHEESRYYYDFLIRDEGGSSYDIMQKHNSEDAKEFIEKNLEIIKNAIEKNELITINKVRDEIKRVMYYQPIHVILLNFISPLNFKLDLNRAKKEIEKLNLILEFDGMECGLSEKKYPYLKSYGQNTIDIKIEDEIRKYNLHTIEMDKINFLFSDRKEIFEQLLKRIDEAEKSYAQGLYLSTLVTLGSVVEGICYTAVDLMKKNGVKFKYFPKMNNNEELEMHRISQYELIKILVEQGLFDVQLLESMKVIKNFRNLIHPYHVDFAWPNVHLCDIAWNMLKLIVEKIFDQKDTFAGKFVMEKKK